MGVDSGSGLGRRYCAFAAVMLACLAAQVPVHAASAEPRFRRIGIEQGLTSGWVTELSEDRDGFIWFATRDGLLRHDGLGFRHFAHDPGDPASIPCADVQTVFPSRSGRLFVGCSDSGFAELVDVVSGRFERFTGPAAALGLRDWSVFSIDEDDSGYLWLGTYQQGIVRFDPRTNQFARLGQLQRIPDALAQALVIELTVAEGRIVAGTADGLWLVAPGADRSQASPLLPKQTITSLLREPGGVLVASGMSVSRLRLDGTGPVFEPLDLPIRNYVDGLARDPAGTLWVATLAGVIEAPPDAAPRTILPRRALSASLPDAKLTDALVDREGGLWLSTSGSGVAYLRPDWRSIELFEHDPLDAATLPAERMQAVAVCADGSQWAISLAGDVVRLDREVRRHARVPAVTAVTAMTCDHAGQLWVGSDAGLQQLDRRFAVARHFRAADGLPPGTVSLLVEGEPGTIWLATTAGGVARIDERGQVLALTTREHGIVAPGFEQLVRAPDGRIWLADGQGLRVFDPDCTCFRPVTGITQRVDSVVFTAPDRLHAYSAGALWSLRLDGPTTVVRESSIGPDAGLPATTASSLRQVAGDRLWMSSARGLFAIDLRQGRAWPLGSHLGAALQFGLRPSAVFRDGVFLDASLGGVVRALPGEPVMAATPARLVLMPGMLEQVDGSRRMLPPGVPWTLRHDDRLLSVDARLLSHVDATANRYRFWLEGAEPGFGQATANPVREFARLPAGDYRVHVSAVDARGVTAADLPVQPIRVLPPWWRSGWAMVSYALGLLMVVGLGFLAYRARLRARHERQLAELRAQMALRATEAKSQFLADIGHEIRTPMSGVIGMADLLLGEPLALTPRRWVETVKRSGLHVLALVNDLLDLSRIEAGQLVLEPEDVVLADLVETVAQMEASLLAARRQVLAVECPPGLRLHVDPRRLRQVLINLLGNACKFTPDGGTIRIRAALAGESVAIAVIDSGPGLTAAEQSVLFARFAQTQSGRREGGSGLGLVISRRLAEAMGGNLDFASTPGQGTTVTVRLPMPTTGSGTSAGMPAMQPHGEADPGGSFAGQRILLVEDDPVIAEAMAGVLASLGSDVRVVHDGLAALTELESTRFDGFISDLDLPALDGFALAGIVAARYPGLFRIAVTARADPEAELRARESGFQAFLRKPVTREQWLQVRKVVSES